jgi:hypothetical protein
MTSSSCLLRHLVWLSWILLTLLGDVVRFLWRCLRLPTALAAGNLFVRTRLVLYRERGLKPRCAPNTTRITLVWLGHWFDWRRALAVVKPAPLIRWHRQGVRRFGRWKSAPGRRRFLQASKPSSGVWPVRIPREVKSGLPTSCG